MTENKLVISDNNQEVKILSASEVLPEVLRSFYSSVYPVRTTFLAENWGWINRAYYNNFRIPLVLLSEEKIIGHAGLIPVTIRVGGKNYPAAWFIDLAVLPEYQRLGYGSILVKKRMEFAEFQMTFPNNRSRGIFKNLGWQLYSNFFVHYVFIKPFNYPSIKKLLPGHLRFLLNKIFFFFRRSLYMRNSLSKDCFSLEIVSPASLEVFLSAYKNSLQTGIEEVIILRDDDYIQWRILSSPNRSHYYIYSHGDFHALIYFNDRVGDSIDVLMMSDESMAERIRTMLCSLALHGEREGFAFVRLITTCKSLKTYVRCNVKSFVKRRTFVYHSKNQSILETMKNLSWRLGLIDSDFEFTN